MGEAERRARTEAMLTQLLKRIKALEDAHVELLAIVCNLRNQIDEFSEQHFNQKETQ